MEGGCRTTADSWVFKILNLCHPVECFFFKVPQIFLSLFPLLLKIGNYELFWKTELVYFSCKSCRSVCRHDRYTAHIYSLVVLTNTNVNSASTLLNVITCWSRHVIKLFSFILWDKENTEILHLITLFFVIVTKIYLFLFFFFVEFNSFSTFNSVPGAPRGEYYQFRKTI